MIELSIYKNRESKEPRRYLVRKRLRKCVRCSLTVLEKGGTGVRGRVKGYTAAGKTGTAYKVEGGLYVKKYVAGFAGYAPAHDPKIVVGIMVDEPMKGKHYGSTAAAPLFSEMVSKTMHLMGVIPDRPEDFAVAIGKPTGKVKTAQAKTGSKGAQKVAEKKEQKRQIGAVKPASAGKENG